jgi:hypothetical protein
MGDRFFSTRMHESVSLALRRIGIGHNGGPPLDTSGEAWLWRKAVAKAWKSPPPEIALRRIAKAERLGITYRELTAVLLDTGNHVSTAFLPLHYLGAMRVGSEGQITLLENAEMGRRVRQFQGRLVLLVDQGIHGRISPGQMRRLGAEIGKRFGSTVEAIEVFPAIDAGNLKTTSSALRRLCRKLNIPRREGFFLGCTADELALVEQFGLAFFKPVQEWFGYRT